MNYQITHRYSPGTVIWSGEIADCESEARQKGYAVIAAFEAGANLTGAYLTGANLTDADLTGAYLTGADLTGAYLARAYLTGADLTGADLTGAYLTGANLTGAYLTGAYLARANLAGANLTRTCLFAVSAVSAVSAWAWAQAGVQVKSIAGRTLVVARRTRTSQHVGAQDYSLPGVYTAAVWSSDTTMECHPGLYLAGRTGDVLCAAWLDEAVGVVKGLRVRRFRRLVANRDEDVDVEVAQWGPDALDGASTIVKGWTE